MRWVIVSYELRYGIECGVLCPYHYYGCLDDVDYSKISHKGSSYDIRDLEKALIIPKRDKAIILKWREKAEGKSTVAFCCSIKHAERVAASFNAEGISAAAYTTAESKLERKAILEKYKNGNISVLCAVDVLNEGADLPFIECLLFLRPTESKRIFYQQLGRGLRRFVGKPICIVIDFIGNFKNAYKIIEYQGLLPFEQGEASDNYGANVKTRKGILDLPLGCEVHFDDSVIDIFISQTRNPAYITRHNIGRILLYQYERLSRRLGRKPTRRDIDANYKINSEIYAIFYGDWATFEKIMG